jgi:hypothetical protein
MSYALHPMKISGNPRKYQAIAHFTRSVNLDGVIERMVEMNPALSPAMARAYIQSYSAAIINLVLEGCKVNTPTGNHGFSIAGLFDGPDDTFSPDRHQLLPTVSPGRDVRRAIHRAGRPRKLESRTPGPHPLAYYDAATESHNQRLTPAKLARLSGYELKFDPADPNQGVFLIAADRTTSRVELMAQNEPRQLIFMNPVSLGPGHYTLEVRAACGDGLRVGRLLEQLEVA